MRWRCGVLLLLALTGCGANMVGSRRATTTACADGASIATAATRNGVHTRFSLHARAHAPDGGPTNVPVPASRVIITDLVWTLTLTLPPDMPPPDALRMETQTFRTPPGERIGRGVGATDVLGPPVNMGTAYVWSGQAYVSPLPQGFSPRAGALLWPQFTTTGGMFSAGQLTFDLHPDGTGLHAGNFRAQPPAECR